MAATEARELYLYTTGTKPFSEMIHGKQSLGEIWRVVRSAEKQYVKDYCSNNESCFSERDVEAAVEEIRYVCRGCKYFDTCGDESRTELCDGRRF